MSASEKIAEQASQELGLALVQILPEMLKPDSKGIEHASEKFRELSSNTAFLPTLTQIMVSHETEIGTRQLAAVLFRRRILKQWKSFNKDMQQLVRQASLEYLYQADKLVYKHLAEIVAGIAEHEIPVDGWPSLIALLQDTTSNTDYGTRLKGTELLKCVSQSATTAMLPQIHEMVTLFGNLLAATDVGAGNADEGQNVHKNVLDAFDAFCPFFEEKDIQIVRSILPRIIQVCEQLIAWDEDIGSEALGVFSEILDLESVNLVNLDTAKLMVELSMKVAINPEFNEETRATALSQLQMLVKYKKKAFTKFQMVNAVIEQMQKLIVDEEDPDDGIMSGVDGDRSVYTGSLQVMDQLAMNIPAEIIISNCAPNISVLLKSNQANHIRAGLLILSVIVEGTADLIMSQYISDLVPAVVGHLNSEYTTVRSAAYFALGQFSEHLQPDIADFAEEIMPQLMRTLAAGANSPEFQNRDVLTKIYYALETFVESLGGKPKGIDMYLDALMTNLVGTLSDTTGLSLYVLECVVGSLGAVAAASEKKFIPYLKDTIDILQNHFPSADTVKQQDEAIEKAFEEGKECVEDKTVLWGRAIATLSSIARGVGPEAFSPYAQTTLDLAVNLSMHTDDCDIKSSAFSLFGALGAIMKEDLASQMNTICDILMNALEENVLDFAGGDGTGDRMNAMANILELSREGEEETDEALTDLSLDDLGNMNVETGPIEAKVTALETMGELAEECPVAFTQYMEPTFKHALRIANLEGALHDEILRASLCACLILSSNLFKAGKLSNNDAAKAAAIAMCGEVWPQILETIENTCERSVCMSLLYHLEKSINIVGETILDNDVLLSVMKTIMMCLEDKTTSQANDEGGAGDADEEQAEHDQLLIEYACDILPTTCLAIGGAKFRPVWQKFYPVLRKRAMSKKGGTTRSAALGAIADIIKASGEDLACEFGPDLIQTFLACTKHKDTNVRNNAVYGIGVIVSLGVNTCGSHFEPILSSLWQVLQTEKMDNVRDQVLGAVSRMALAIGNCQNVNINTAPILQGLIKELPVKSDPSELGPVVLCIEHYLASLSDQDVLKVIKGAASMAEDYGDVFDDTTKLAVTRLLKKVQDTKGNALAALNSEEQSALQNVMVN